MNTTNLKETHPQKYYLRNVCKALFYLGFGTYWYEVENAQYPRLYAAWCLFINSFIAVGTLDKVLAYLRHDINDEAKAEIIETGCTEAAALLKLYIMISKRDRIREVLKRLLEEGRDIFTSTELEGQAAKKAKCLSYLMLFGAYAYLTLMYGRIIVVSYIEGAPLQTQITYFPTSALVGFPFNLLRILVICHFYVLVTMYMISECLCILCLIFIAAKFKVVQKYFEIMRENSECNWNLEDFKKHIISGVKLHENALWCARNVQNALGHVYGIQIYLSIFCLGIWLLKFVDADRTLMNLVVGLIYSFIIILLTACYMLNSGDITHEAAGVATAVFHCGWERGRGRGARALLVVAACRAQRPVLMTAFGFLDLSYENFISVLRSAYSFFAVVY